MIWHDMTCLERGSVRRQPFLTLALYTSPTPHHRPDWPDKCISPYFPSLHLMLTCMLCVMCSVIWSGYGLRVHVHIESIKSRPRLTSATLPTRERQNASRPFPGRPVIEVWYLILFRSTLSLSFCQYTSLLRLLLHCSALLYTALYCDYNVTRPRCECI